MGGSNWLSRVEKVSRADKERIQTGNDPTRYSTRKRLTGKWDAMKVLGANGTQMDLMRSKQGAAGFASSLLQSSRTGNPSVIPPRKAGKIYSSRKPKQQGSRLREAMTVAKLRPKRRLVKIYILNCWTLKPFTVSRILPEEMEQPETDDTHKVSFGHPLDKKGSLNNLWLLQWTPGVRALMHIYATSNPLSSHSLSSLCTESPGSSDLRNSPNVWDEHQGKQKAPRGRKTGKPEKS